jgi:hypothetical protein
LGWIKETEGKSGSLQEKDLAIEKKAGGMNYLICKHGTKITVKRSDKNHDFGKVINCRMNFLEALQCARIERMVLRRAQERGLRT